MKIEHEKLSMRQCIVLLETTMNVMFIDTLSLEELRNKLCKELNRLNVSRYNSLSKEYEDLNEKYNNTMNNLERAKCSINSINERIAQIIKQNKTNYATN